ncbi:MAG: hypothetical protein EZS28_004107 [Streblomastix strix]|uniref:Uncharacterized protein n=1 Tax=Streblomastix strix TaxID=222440 RepID=A0A5J4X0V7_9EUKA|nr:MAG: hypothetical protein EZS28_004107 [Streblomastix strix]
MSAGSSLYGARHKHKAQHRKKSQTQHAFEDNESVEQAVEDADEEAAEERSGSDGNLDLRMLMQEMTPQRAATLQEDLLFAPQMHGQLQAEYVGQRALEAVGHLSISGTYLPFPAEFARPLVEGQSILQPPPAKINPIPFEQRLQQFKQSLMQK